MGYCAVFAFFPFLLILVSLGSALLESADTQELVVRGVTRLLPVTSELVTENIERVVAGRSTGEVVGAVRDGAGQGGSR